MNELGSHCNLYQKRAAYSSDSYMTDLVLNLQDMKARTTKALREINTWRRYGLTGTALQNNLLEFWSILDW